jgi:hypothetical protein
LFQPEEVTVPLRLNFREIAASIDIFDVAAYLKLAIVKNRTTCPACESERAIEFYPETNTFFCHSAKVGADCISLLAHVRNQQGQYAAAKELSEHFHTAGADGKVATHPEAVRAEPTAPKKLLTGAGKKSHDFDPVAFAAKLTYSEEVKALGISEEDAETFSIGFHRGKVYIPLRHDDGTIAGFIGHSSEGLKLPPSWLPKTSNVVKLPKRA